MSPKSSQKQKKGARYFPFPKKRNPFSRSRLSLSRIQSGKTNQHETIENQLRHIKEQYYSLIRHIDLGVSVIDRNYRVLQVNPRMQKWFQRSEKSFLGKKCFQQFENQKHVCPDCPGRIAMKTGRVAEVLREGVRKNGDRFFMRLRAVPNFDQKGRVLGFIEVVENTTKRQLAEETLSRRESYLSAMIENQPGMVWLKDIEGRFLAVNQLFAEACGLKNPQRVIGLTDLDIWPLKLAQKYRSDDQRVMRRRRSLVVEERIMVEGVKKWYETFKTPVINKAGNVIGTSGFARDITTRKRAEDELKQSFSLLTSTLESTADGILVVDQKGKITGFNQKFAEMWRMPKKILVSKDDQKAQRFVLSQLQCPRDFSKKVRWLYAHPEKDSFDQIEFKDGRTFERYSHPQWLDSRPIGRVWSFRDVTERKKAEKMLADSRQRLKHVVDSVPGIVYEFVLHPDGRMELPFISAGVERIFGFPAQLLQRDFSAIWKILHPEDVEAFRDSIFNAAKHFRPWSHEFRVLLPSGSVAWLFGNSVPVSLEGDPAKHWRGTLIDISKLKQAEKSLEEGRYQLRQIIDAVPHMIFAKDRQGRFLLVNKAVALMYGKDPKDLIGKRRQDIHSMSHEVEAYLKSDQEALASGKPEIIADEKFTDAKGNLHILQTIKAPFKMQGIDDVVILGVAVDVTEQKKVEDFRNDIIRTISHELRTPLSIEKEGVNLLLDESAGEISPDQRMILEAVMKNINRLSRMIDDLLSVSHIEAGKMTLKKGAVDFRDIVKEVIFEFKPKIAEKKIHLVINLPEAGVKVHVDSDKIVQVLSNLLDNALKFTREGSIVVSVQPFQHEVECSVQDTGIGIEPQHIANIFEKFHQFARSVGPGEKGLGLGLSIAKGIIEMHHGRIWAKSELGKGTKVTFSLPLQRTGGLKHER